ncbi:NYN domain-containing protein [Mycobacteroides chelonae]|uniref:NYN domain-containing protein n=1 Tax=Mycobacteroides chelonae TaxID=1774 RepID=UPI000993A787|nr:NYN domain-containing protein [Mycobacteroides chelonae]
MRIGVYIDGYNLYYGGKRLFASNSGSWKWFSPRGIAESALHNQQQFAAGHGWGQMVQDWSHAYISRVVYCTARVNGPQNPSAQADQDVYLKALVAAGAVDHIEYGNYVARVKVAPLAVTSPTSTPTLVQSNWPVMVKDAVGNEIRNANFFVSYLHNEEKGSDVNVAAHLLIDTLDKQIDGAIVISNDSDLKLPIAQARDRIPVGVVNPGSKYTSGDLQPAHAVGQGPHWNRRLRPADFTSNQLSDPSGIYPKPAGW